MAGHTAWEVISVSPTTGRGGRRRRRPHRRRRYRAIRKSRALPMAVFEYGPPPRFPLERDWAFIQQGSAFGLIR
jgi:hypothetical protein